MIVQDSMKTQLVTVAPDDTLSHAATLFRQHQFHHLPVARTVKVAGPSHAEYQEYRTRLIFEGLISSQDIELAASLAGEKSSSQVVYRPWQEQRIAEFMHPSPVSVTATTSVGAAAQLLVERGLSYLPVVEYDQEKPESPPFLVGLLTRSDLLLILARAMGTFEPGMQLDIVLPLGNVAPLAQTLLIATELHMHIRSLLAVPLSNGVPKVASLRLGTINPAPLLLRLQGAGIEYTFASPLEAGKSHA